ncbi:MAG: VOC family protein [Olsenella sp.]|jgi:hypothetical protein
MDAKGENPVEKFGMYIAHIGVNAEADEDTMRIVDEFCGLLGLEHMTVAPVSEFAGDFVEVMKPGHGCGERGHIGFHVNDVEAAARWFDEHGSKIDWDHCAKNPDGSLFLVYFEREIAGFAIHLTAQR